MTTLRVQQVRAADIQPGAVLDNVARLFVVEARHDDGQTVRITYRYTDDRGLIQRETMAAARGDIFRVRSEADPEIVDGILNATVGLPR